MAHSDVYFTTFKATGQENLLKKLHRRMTTAGLATSDWARTAAACRAGLLFLPAGLCMWMAAAARKRCCAVLTCLP